MKRRWALGLASALPAMCILAWHARQFYPFMADDSFISLRYSQRLLQGYGLTWSDYERVEGYSNLLWVLLCAAVGRVVDLVWAARIVGVGSTLALFATIGVWCSRTWAGVLAALLGTSLLALSGPVAVWAIGGLEQPLLCALLAAGLVGTMELTAGSEGTLAPRVFAATALALTCLVRPDAPLLVFLALAGALLARFSVENLKRFVLLGAPALAAILGQFAFRLAYYDSPVPNTAYLKLAYTMVRVQTGLDYVVSGWRVMVPCALFAAAGLLFDLAAGKLRRALPAVLALAGWVAYLVLIGGDIFPARRHLVVVLVLLVLLGLRGVEGLIASTRWPLRASAVLGAVVASLWGGFAWGTTDPRSLEARGEQWEWLGEVSGRLFVEAFAPYRPLIAVHSAGCVPYFSGLPAIDMLGLNDSWIARHPPADFGRSSVSYDLHAVGDPEYVIRRQPDLILPCGPLGSAEACPNIPSAPALFNHPRFRADFVPMHFLGSRPFEATGIAWVRTSSPVAVTRREDGYLLSPALLARGPAFLRLDQGRAVVEFPPRSRVLVDHLPMGGRIDASELGAIVANMTPSGLVLENPSDAPVKLEGIRLRVQ